MKLKFLSLVVFLSLSMQAFAQPLEFWILGVFSNEAIRNKITPFISLLESKTERGIKLTVSSNFSEVFNSCPRGVPHITVSSFPYVNELRKKCQYKIQAVSFQDIHLLVKNESGKTVSSVKNIGAIRNVLGTRIAKNEMLTLSKNYKIIEYPNLLSIIRRVEKDNLDAIVLTEKIASNVQPLKIGWKSSYMFGGKGIAVIMTSPSLDTSVEDSIQDVVLSDHASVIDVWQKNIGLGKFLSPSELHGSELEEFEKWIAKDGG